MQTIPIPFKDKILHDIVKGLRRGVSRFLSYGGGEGLAQTYFRFLVHSN